MVGFRYLFPMHMNHPLRLIALALTLSFTFPAFAEEPAIRSCSRLSGQQKAVCEYENHKIYKELAKQQVPVEEEVSEEPTPVVELPSCSRKQGKEKANCLWENQKFLKASLIGDDEPKAKALGVPAACKKLKGKERARCITKARKQARQR